METFKPWANVQRSDFKTVAYLGKGSFGEVRLVLYLGNGVHYAMKSIQKELLHELLLSGYEGIVSPIIEKDVGVAARDWRSPFIVELYATFQTPNKLHYIYEFCPGGDLFELMTLQDHGRFSEQAARFYLAEIALGLAHLHARDVVHRDVKLENVLVARDSHVKLADFGSALPGSQKSGSYLQTTFTPPEVRRGEGKYGKELDCWQLGNAAFAMLTGCYPQEDGIVFADSLAQSGASEAAFDFCQALLADDRSERLGFPDGASLLRPHAFFASVDWQVMEGKEYEPPFLISDGDIAVGGARPRLDSSPNHGGVELGRVRAFTWALEPDLEDQGQ